MSVTTNTGAELPNVLFKNYFRNLVNRFFKILPMRENEEESLDVYMKSLQIELLGCESFIPGLQKNSMYLSLLSILQYLIDTPDCTVDDTKREVFSAISMCYKLKALYSHTGVSK